MRQTILIDHTMTNEFIGYIYIQATAYGHHITNKETQCTCIVTSLDYDRYVKLVNSAPVPVFNIYHSRNFKESDVHGLFDAIGNDPIKQPKTV